MAKSTYPPEPAETAIPSEPAKPAEPDSPHPVPHAPDESDPERPFRKHDTQSPDRDVDLPERPGPPLNDPENPHGKAV